MQLLAQDALPWAKIGDSIVGLVAIAMMLAFLAYLKGRDKSDREAEKERAARFKELGAECHTFQAEQMKQMLSSRGRLEEVIERNTTQLGRNNLHLERVSSGGRP